MPTYHHGNLRAALLERAEAVIERDGPADVSLRALARELDVSHGAPARHFPDRQALLDAVALSGFTRLTRALSTAASGTDPVPDRFAEVARAYVGFAVDRPGLLDVMFTSKHHERASEELVAAGHACMAPVVTLVEAAQEAGVVRAGAPADLAQVAFAAVHGVATLAVGGMLDETPVDAALDRTVAMIWDGLRARPADDGASSPAR